MAAIRKLDAAVARRINSEQVITDVRSVVKELLENSLDAGATRVTIELEDSGLEAVRVSDNGCGIPADSRGALACGHCTSKIATLSDLAALRSYGFRGEALHSCCEAAGAVTVVTRCAGERAAVRLTFDRQGLRQDQAPAAPTDPDALMPGAQTGTTVCVRRLWERHPVRRQTMQKENTPALRLQELVTAYALVLPHVAITLRQPPAREFRTPGGPRSRMVDSIDAVYGPLLRNELVEVSWLGGGAAAADAPLASPTQLTASSSSSSSGSTAMSTTTLADRDMDVKVTGFLPARSACRDVVMRRANNKRMFISVNKRPVELRAVTKMVTAHLRRWFTTPSADVALPPPGRKEPPKKGVKLYPFVLLDLQIPPNKCDFNVSPDKRKLILRDERALLDHIARMLNDLFPLHNLQQRTAAAADEDIAATQLATTQQQQPNQRHPPDDGDDIVVDATQLAKPTQQLQTEGNGGSDDKPPPSKKRAASKFKRIATDESVVELEAESISRSQNVVLRPVPRNAVLVASLYKPSGTALIATEVLPPEQVRGLSVIGVVKVPSGCETSSGGCSDSMWMFVVADKAFITATVAAPAKAFLFWWFGAEEAAEFEKTRASRLSVAKDIRSSRPIVLNEAAVGNADTWQALQHPSKALLEALQTNGFAISSASPDSKEIWVTTVPQGLQPADVPAQICDIVKQVSLGVRHPLAGCISKLVIEQATSIAHSLTEPPTLERGAELLRLVIDRGITLCPHGKTLFFPIGLFHSK